MSSFLGRGNSEYRRDLESHLFHSIVASIRFDFPDSFPDGAPTFRACSARTSRDRTSVAENLAVALSKELLRLGACFLQAPQIGVGTRDGPLFLP